MNRTIVVRRDYLHYIKKYARCVRQPQRTAPKRKGGRCLHRGSAVTCRPLLSIPHCFSFFYTLQS